MNRVGPGSAGLGWDSRAGFFGGGRGYQSFHCRDIDASLNERAYDPLGGTFRRVLAASGADAAMAWARDELMGAAAILSGTGNATLADGRRGRVVNVRALSNNRVLPVLVRGHRPFYDPAVKWTNEGQGGGGGGGNRGR